MDTLVLSGIAEQTKGNLSERREADIESVKAVVDHLGFQNFEPMECSRIGPIRLLGHRLLRIKCKTMETKKNILTAARTLRESAAFKHIFVNADETFAQRK